jgi:ketosteroid isomerase-like protein
MDLLHGQIADTDGKVYIRFSREAIFMEMSHIKAFTEAMKRKDLEGMLAPMADDVVLNTPLAAEPVRGKAAVRQVVGTLLKVVNKFDFQELMQGPVHVSSFYTLTSGTIELDGMDYWRLDEAGLIKEMTVLWRPLPEVSQVQKKLG